MDARLPLPREHGAWAQAALTLGAATALVPGFPPGFWAWTGAVVLAFLAHEPLLVLLGQRGARVRSERGGTSALWLGSLGAGAIALGLLGLQGSPLLARKAALLPTLPALLLLPGILRGEEKSLAGEALAALALAGASAPLALRGGASLGPALGLAAGLGGAFLLGTLLVRQFLAGLRRRPEPLSVYGAPLLTGLGAGAGLILLAQGRWLPGLACLPLPLLGARLLARPWQPHQLKRLGWALAAGELATATLLVFALR
ncbi:MAG TPA: YwiC-like family protein [Holophagaceae bacterium]|nr:YwiC-like family protein [Holophagaceae bacterium]